MDTIVKAYTGDGQAEAGRKFLADSQTLEKSGYRVVSQSWKEDDRGFFMFRLFPDPLPRSGTLTVTYQLVANPNGPVAPKTD